MHFQDPFNQTNVNRPVKPPSNNGMVGIPSPSNNGSNKAGFSQNK